MPVSWTSKKQGGVSLSTMDAEFVAVSNQARELLGIREMLNEIGKMPMVPHVDHQAALKKMAGEASSLKAKQIDVRTKFVCNYARRGIFVSQYVRLEKQLADLLTKVLEAVKLALLCELISLG